MKPLIDIKPIKAKEKFDDNIESYFDNLIKNRKDLDFPESLVSPMHLRRRTGDSPPSMKDFLIPKNEIDTNTILDRAGFTMDHQTSIDEPKCIWTRGKTTLVSSLKRRDARKGS